MSDTYEYLLQDGDILQQGTDYKVHASYTSVPFFAPDANTLMNAFASQATAFAIKGIDFSIVDNTPDFTIRLKTTIQSINAGAVRMQMSNVLSQVSDTTNRLIGLNIDAVREPRAMPADPNAPIKWQTLTMWVIVAVIIVALVVGLRTVRDFIP